LGGARVVFSAAVPVDVASHPPDKPLLFFDFAENNGVN
jgi:hypothetical protein